MPRTWPGALGVSSTPARRPGPEGEGTPVGEGRAGRACRGRAAAGRSGHKARQCQAWRLPPSRPPSIPPSRSAGSVCTRPRPQRRPKAVVSGWRKAQRGGAPGCQGEKHPKACKLLLSAFFFLLLLLGRKKKKKKKAALPLEADAKRMQNFNHLLHWGFPQQGLGPGLARPRRGGGWPEHLRPLSRACWKARPPLRPHPEAGPRPGV